MSQDIVADGLNKIMNAKRASKSSVKLRHYSKFLLSVLAIGKLRGYIEEYKIEGKQLEVSIGNKFNYCGAVKPRYSVRADEIIKYVRRYLPARDMGVLVISTSKGIMTHHTAIEKKIGGSVIAYFY